MFSFRLNGRAHPMGSKIHSFNKAILKRQQGDGHVNIEKSLEQVFVFVLDYLYLLLLIFI